MTGIVPYVLTLVFVGGACFLAFLLARSMRDARLRYVESRLRGLDDDMPGTLLLAEQSEPKTASERMDRDFDELVEETGLGLSTAQALGIIALFAVIGAGIPLLVRLDFGLAAVGMLAGVALPLGFFLIQRAQRHWTIQGQLPDSFFLLARSLRAGLNLEQSLATVARYGTSPLAGEFRRVVDQVDLGLTVQAALQGMSRRLKMVDFNSLVTAVTLHRTVGGNLANLLERVANSVRDRNLFRGYFLAATALARMTAFFIAAALPVLLLGYSIWQPDFLARFTASPLGVRMLLTAIALEIVGIVWLLWLLRVEY